MDFSRAAMVINSMIALIFSLTFREAAQALVARLLGDRTAEHEGRLTLNPIPHIDPVGTLIFPFIGSLLGGFIFGWAKPVPIDSRYFKNQKTGVILVALTGPAANLILSFLSLVIYYAIGQVTDSNPLIAVSRLMMAMVSINAILAIFNLIPVHPLDGGKVLYELLSYEMKQKYDEFVVPYGGFVLLGLMLIGGFRWVAMLAQVWIAICENIVRGFMG